MDTGKRTLPALIAILLLSITIVLPSAGAEGEEGQFHVVCANSALADLTTKVVGDVATVEYIMPAGACPSHFDSRPSDVNQVASADVIVQIGWEGWLNQLITSSGNDGVPRVRTADLGEWNIPEGAKAHVDHIAEELGTAFPEHASIFTANAEAYKAEIDAKAEELRSLMRAEGVEGRHVVCMGWQKRFVEWLGFKVVATYGPPEGLSVEEMLNVTEAASGADVCMIVDNLQSGTDFGAQVASETGVSHVIVTNFPGAIPGTGTYLDMLEYNAGKLIDGAQTYEYKKGDIARLESQVADLEFQSTLYLSMAVMFLLLAMVMAMLFIRARNQGE